MAQRKRNRGHLAAAGPIGSLAGSALHSVDAHPDTRGLHLGPPPGPVAQFDLYEPLTALPMRRAVIMLLCGKADVVHDDRPALSSTPPPG